MPASPKPKGLYYGWYVVGAMFFMALIGVGPRQGLGMFFDRWTEDFGVGFWVLSTMAAIGWVVNGLANPIVGGLTDRFGGRVVMSVSMLVVGLGSFGLSLAVNIWTLALVYIPFVSFGMAGTLFVPASALASRWFKRRRGTAISLLTSGGSVGGMLMVPFMAYLFELTTWRLTWMVVGGIMLGAAPLLWLVLRDNPRELGQWPDGDDGPSDAEAARSTTGLGRQGPLAVDRWQSAYRSKPMWLLTASYVVCGITTGSIAIHFVPYATSNGVSVTTAALAFGLLNFVNLGGVLLTGVISDRLLRKDVLTVIYAVRAVAFVALVVLPTGPGLWVFAVVGGASWLATVPQTGALVADVYGVRRAGTLNGMLTMVHQIGGAGAIAVAGLVFDFTDSYTPFFVFAAATLAVASIISWMLRERLVSVRYVQGDPPAPGLAAEGA